MKIYNNVYDIIGKTPLLLANRTIKENGLLANLFVKLEGFNPTGSVKDRASLNMILEGEKSGALSCGSTIIEPTSGNTGIGLASIAVQKGYRIILTMPESMSIERRKLLKAYGAELVLTDKALGMQGAVDKAIELSKEIENSFIPSQFDNPANPEAHITTATEIFEDLDGNVDLVIAGIGTGGTISGIAKVLKSKLPNVKIVGVEPKSSPLITEGMAGSHAIQGIGANFIPKNYDSNLVDEVIAISDEDAINTAKAFGKIEGVLVGISSGASIYAGMQLSKRADMKGKNIVVISPDGGEKYLSTALFED